MDLGEELQRSLEEPPEDALAAVPAFSVGATFLDANSQAHHKPFSAFGDLADNARESEATKLWIGVEPATAAHPYLTITLTENGRGMSEMTLRTGIGGIGHSNKAHRSEVHYGMGAKSALPRLSPNSLVLTKNGKMRTAALISTTLSREHGSHELKVPIVSWAAARSGSSTLLRETTADAPLTHEQRARSLEVLLRHTPYATADELLAQFDAIPGSTGTRLVMYEVGSSHFELSVAGDVRIPTHEEEGAGAEGGGGGDGAPAGRAAKEAFVPDHDTSLRAYLHVLYYADASERPNMKVYLRGSLVPPRDWTAFLHTWPEERRPYEYTPQCLNDERRRAAEEGDAFTCYGATARFGTAATPLAEVLGVLEKKGGAGLTAEDRARKRYFDGCAGGLC